MNHAPLRHAPPRHLPDFLDAGRVDLRRAPLLQPQPRRQALRERAPRALAQHGHLRADVGARLEIGFPVSVAVDPLVAGAHAHHLLPVEQRLYGGHSRQHVSTRRLEKPRHPLLEVAERDDVVSVVLKRRGKDGEADLSALREVEEIVGRDRALDGRALGDEVGEKLRQRPGIQHAARDPVRADLGGFLEDRDRHIAERRSSARRRVLLVALEELGEPERAGEPRWPAADEQDVDFEDVPLLGHFEGAFSRPAATGGGSACVACFRSSR